MSITLHITFVENDQTYYFASNHTPDVRDNTGTVLLLLSTSYTKYKISINTKEKQKEKQKKYRKAKKIMTVTTSLYAQMFYGRTNVIFTNSTVR